MNEIVVAFDVDGTLLTAKDEVNEDIRNLLRLLHDSLENVHIVVWSGSGKDYAEYMGRRLFIGQWVDEYAAKGTVGPVDIAIDDEDVKLGQINLMVRRDA